MQAITISARRKQEEGSKTIRVRSLRKAPRGWKASRIGPQKNPSDVDSSFELFEAPVPGLLHEDATMRGSLSRDTVCFSLRYYAPQCRHVCGELLPTLGRTRGANGRSLSTIYVDVPVSSPPKRMARFLSVALNGHVPPAHRLEERSPPTTGNN